MGILPELINLVYVVIYNVKMPGPLFLDRSNFNHVNTLTVCVKMISKI